MKLPGVPCACQGVHALQGSVTKAVCQTAVPLEVLVLGRILKARSPPILGLFPKYSISADLAPLAKDDCFLLPPPVFISSSLSFDFLGDTLDYFFNHFHIQIKITPNVSLSQRKPFYWQGLWVSITPALLN